MKTRSYDYEDYFVDVEIGQTGPFKTSATAPALPYLLHPCSRVTAIGLTKP